MISILLQGFPRTPEQFLNQYGGLIGAVAAFIAGFLIVYAVGRFVLVPLVRRVLAVRGFEETIIGPAGRIVHAFVVLVAIGVAFTVAGYGAFLSSLAIFSGALSLAIGVAAQDLLANFAAGLYIIQDRPFDVGDWIEWDDNAGIVQEIRLRVTQLRTYNNEIITVPNSDLANNAIVNQAKNGRLRICFPFGISYDDDIDAAIRVLITEAEQQPMILDEPEPFAGVSGLGDSAIELEAQVWIDDPSQARYVRLRAEYVQAVKERFDAEDIQIPYPQRTLSGGTEVGDAVTNHHTVDNND